MIQTSMRARVIVRGIVVDRSGTRPSEISVAGEIVEIGETGDVRRSRGTAMVRWRTPSGNSQLRLEDDTRPRTSHCDERLFSCA